MKHVVFLLCMFAFINVNAQTFRVRSATNNDFKIRVWVNGSLIHDHIMRKGDQLEIHSNSGALIQVNMIETECDPNGKPGTSKLESVYKDGWLNITVPPEQFKRFMGIFNRGIYFEDPPCLEEDQV